MISEIGSNFWINPEDLDKPKNLGSPEQFGIRGSDYVWLSTGRSATALVLDTIEERNPDINKIAILPPFTCHTVIEPLLAKGYKIETYHVDKNLYADPAQILQTVINKKASVLLFHRYFGIDTTVEIEKIFPELKASGVVTIEDCTQCLYSDFKKTGADYYVGSIRKWCGTPDGGFAVCKEGRFSCKPTEIDLELQESKKQASLMKYHYMIEGKGDKQEFLSKYREAEDILYSQKDYFKISDLSAIVQSNIDVKQLKDRRRKNFMIIADGLSGNNDIKPIFETLSSGEVPLYCPLLCKNRAQIQTLLAQNNVFAPIIWRKAECCPAIDADSDYVYENILCIPVDQRYDVDDMERVIGVLNHK